MGIINIIICNKYFTISQATILKPYWISHSNQAIFTIDIHPDNRKFATGGEDHIICIWSFNFNIDKKSKADIKKIHKITDHTGPVNCVRWSPSGLHLASASADHTILIFTHKVEKIQKEDISERWERIFTGYGHKSDVEDLTWSPDGKFLASAGLDVTIMIWYLNGSGEFNHFRTLKNNSDWIKGLSWDPLNKYIAVQSCDGSCTLWKISTWEPETIIKQPFVKQTKLVFEES